MKATKDNFSSGPADYSKFRPSPPDEIFMFLFDNTPATGAAWDVGTGNGQAALILAEKFDKVYATDISTKQLAAAQKRSNITYLTERTEQTSLPTDSVDLITVAQAIHWFDFEKFYTEAKRVGRKGALLAAWTYTLLEISPEIDAVVRRLFFDITGDYWDPERRHVDEEYRTIPFPFREIPTPVFYMTATMTLEQLLGYLGTWSGVAHYRRQLLQDPVELIRAELTSAWGTATERTTRWPLHMRAGHIL